VRHLVFGGCTGGAIRTEVAGAMRDLLQLTNGTIIVTGAQSVFARDLHVHKPPDRFAPSNSSHGNQLVRQDSPDGTDPTPYIVRQIRAVEIANGS
jgi:hypothetical protein